MAVWAQYSHTTKLFIAVSVNVLNVTKKEH
jgi:hypothetical protein